MEGEELDWTSETLRKALLADHVNGFGFQCTLMENSDNPCIYLGIVTREMARSPNGFPSHEIDARDRAAILTRVRGLAGNGDDAVWFHDWLGSDYLTVKLALYPRIADIISELFAMGFCLTTTTRPKVRLAKKRFMQRFTRGMLEREIIRSLREAYNQFVTAPLNAEAPDPARATWAFMRGICNTSAVLLHWNWATREGREFCDKVRAEMGKKPRSASKPRMLWGWYNDVARRYDILHRGGWSAYRPDLGDQPLPGDPVLAVVDDNNEKEDDSPRPLKRSKVSECMICLDAEASTTVAPCGHSVVCDQCSRRLRETNDNAICTQCRCPITHVFYSDNEVEEKR